jgi:hypothetical protein
MSAELALEMLLSLGQYSWAVAYSGDTDSRLPEPLSAVARRQQLLRIVLTQWCWGRP